MPLAAPIALGSIVAFLENEPHRLELVRLVLYPREDPAAYTVYAEALRTLLSARTDTVIG